MQNLFGQAKVELPSTFQEKYNKYCQHSNTGAREKPHKYPFPRNVDMWFLSICIAVELEIEPDLVNLVCDFLLVCDKILALLFSIIT